jgi:signal recognition particle GTPase
MFTALSERLTTAQEVNRLLDQFQQMRKLLKRT